MSKHKHLNPVAKGELSELRVLERLITLGFKDVRMTQPKAPHDLFVDGYPVEVKYSNPSRGGALSFSIRKRNGKEQHPVIAYVLCMDGIPDAEDWTFLVVPAPIRQVTYVSTLESLKGRDAPFINNWQLLQPIPYKLQPRKLPGRLYPGSGMYGAMALRSSLSSCIAACIKMYMMTSRLNITAVARKLGFPRKTLQDVMSGEMEPSGDMLYALCMRTR